MYHDLTRILRRAKQFSDRVVAFKYDVSKAPKAKVYTLFASLSFD